MTSITIKSIDDLRSEISRLELAETQQAALLKQRFSSPSALFATALTLFPKSATADGIKSAGFFKQDFVGLISRFVLPVLLNKTFFRKSNFLVKALVGVLSQKASAYVNEDTVTGVWGKLKSLVGNIHLGKKKQEPEPDPRIPPLSETY
ncbi:hypothetical protein GCM10023149_44340 [Mucilaginibacter gynuensis]|uniref:Uncharacterized protein n=1 Tax=Mucilaginibacter gynuensis TaxID=1302236 RepID=A0ABP8H8V1_9SPHI